MQYENTCLPVAPARADGRLSVPDHILQGLQRCQTFTERTNFAACHGFNLKTLTYDEASLNPSTWAMFPPGGQDLFWSDRVDVKALREIASGPSAPRRRGQEITTDTQ